MPVNKIFAVDGGYRSFWVKPWIQVAKVGLKKLQKSFYGTVQSRFRYLEPFRRDSLVLQTDGQTHRHSLNRCCA